ncbi:MAG TPA: RNA polymerase sigma-54 factor [Lentisphaeria bacterium]|nr:RNA polymerase sigma-54 factor [Lentisphaeria bacterium]
MASPTMGFVQATSQQMRQEQTLTRQQIQALQILTAPYMELQARINQEVSVNPALESLSSESEQLIGDPTEDATNEPTAGDDAAAAAEKDEYIAGVLNSDPNWRDYVPPNHATQSHSTDDEERREYFFNSLTTKKGLGDDLIEQLSTMDCTTEIEDIATLIIGNIDPGGYLRADRDEIMEVADCSESQFDQALTVVQALDPAGIGGRDMRECLLLQLQRSERSGTLAYTLVDKYLDQLAKNRIPDICDALGVKPSDIYEARKEIRGLQPRPGNSSPSQPDQFVIPEVIVELNEDNSLEIVMNESCKPRFQLSDRYLALLEDPATPADVKKYIREKVNNGHMLLNSVSQRHSTILRIAESVMAHQREFLDRGDVALKPLTMTQVADELGMHETTVGRAIANKYMLTPRGLIAFRHFFSTGGVRSDDGEDISIATIKTRIKALISEEVPAKPLSDQRLAEMLKKEGFNVARRTVAKYREALGVQSSQLRKSYG